MTTPETTHVHDEEIDSAIAAVSNPDAPYSPEALTLAAAVRQLRAERDRLDDEVRALEIDLAAERETTELPTELPTDPEAMREAAFQLLTAANEAEAGR